MRYRVATQDDLAELTAVIATAFGADPVWGAYSFPDDGRRLAQSSAVWSAFLAAVLRFGWTFVTPGCEAAAVWVPPGETELLPEHERELESIAERQLGAGQAAIMFDAFERLESAHPHDPPHYYLSLLGTHADHRGNGIGMKLLAATLEAVDRERMPAYLESTNPANDARYMRVGFQPYGRLALPNGHIITTMWRPPARRPGLWP
jgi:GNAT superfamily N-acetyltransferase